MNKRAYIFYLIIFVVGFSISYLCGYKMGTSDLKNVTIKSDAVKANNENKKEGYWLIAKDNIKDNINTIKDIINIILNVFSKK